MQIKEPLKEMVRPELDKGETVIWADRPDPKRFMRRSIPTIIVGIIWTLGTSPFILTFLTNPDDGGQLMKGHLNNFDAGPLILIAFSLLITNGAIFAPLSERKSALHTVYAVTDTRLIIIHAASNRTVKSYYLNEVYVRKMTVRTNGDGDLTLSIKAPKDNQSAIRLPDAELMGIKNVRITADLFRRNFEQEQV